MARSKPSGRLIRVTDQSDPAYGFHYFSSPAVLGFPAQSEATAKQQPEFHNGPGRPKGSKTKNRRNPPKPENQISKAAKRKRRSRLRKSVTEN
jgi:hypothetical protein